MASVEVPEHVASYWESLASEGAIPFAWIDDPQRSFAHDACVRMPCKRCGGKGCRACDKGRERHWTHLVRYTSIPASVAACDAVRERADLMVTAEAYARELARAMQPWGVRTYVPFVWRFSAVRAVATPMPKAFAPVVAMLERLEVAREVPPVSVSERWFLWPSRVWSQAVAAQNTTPRRSPVGMQRMDALPDPFRALEELFALKVSVFELSNQRIVLSTFVADVMAFSAENPLDDGP